MKPSFDDGFAKMFVGDAIDVLARLPEQSVHCCVTSPPYFGLRSYLAADHASKAQEGGTQETPEKYVEWLVDVMRGVWRVLRDDGTVWLNLGDSYISGPANNTDTNWSSKQASNLGSAARRKRSTLGSGKPKDLLMIPARVALALQADGWYLRSQIVWAKPNPMPESITDRPTQATEMIYLLSKKPKYFYDAEAVKERGVMPEGENRGGSIGRGECSEPMEKISGFNHRGPGFISTGTRNLRNVWKIATKPYTASHYATFPPELPERCIKAGCPEDGTVLDPFSGSGTALMTARKLGRKSIGIDLDERNVKLLEERLGYQGVLL